MRTLKLLFGLGLIAISLQSCIIETGNYYNGQSLEEVVTNYDLWYVDYNRTTGYGDVPFLYLPRAACETCHAAWSVLDLGRNLMRQDAPDLEDWKFLKVQGSSEIEAAVDKWAASETDPPAGSLTMTDKINGTEFPGLWFAGFEQRRWAPVVLGIDKKGVLSVIRPLLDLSIFYVNSEGDVPFDSMTPDPAGSGAPPAITKIIYPPLIQITPLPAPHLWLPYHPHTVGKADEFRTRAVRKFLLSASP